MITRLLGDERLCAHLGVYDVARRETACAVLEAYGTKVVASSSFTAGLVERGICRSAWAS